MSIIDFLQISLGLDVILLVHIKLSQLPFLLKIERNFRDILQFFIVCDKIKTGDYNGQVLLYK